jgi:hypothetical protein
MLFTSIRDGKQADIYEYDFASDKLIQFAATEESEYSPTLSLDGKYIYTVRVEKDETQRLWMFDLKKKKPELCMPKVDSVGYFTFLSKDKLALFILGEPQTLRIADLITQNEKIIDSNIGRALYKYPLTNDLYYVDKSIEENWKIKRFTDNKIEDVINLPKETEDFCITPEGLLLCFSKNKLLGFYPAESRSWFVLAEINEMQGKKISRLTIHPEMHKLAFVVAE